MADEKNVKRDWEFSTYRRGKGADDDSSNPGNDILKGILKSMEKIPGENGGNNNNK